MKNSFSIKIISAVVVSAVMLTSFSVFACAVSSASSPFTDVRENDWFYDDVIWAYERGYVKGCSNQKFEPQVNLTQAAMLTILYRASGEPKFENKVNFGAHFESTDDDFYKAKNSWYYTPFCWAGTVGIIDAGRAETAIRRLISSNETPLTRADLAFMLWNYAEAAEIVLPLNNEFKGFGDVKEDAWFHDATEMLYKAGIMLGRSDTEFCPDEYATRAEAAAVIERIITAMRERILYISPDNRMYIPADTIDVLYFALIHMDQETLDFIASYEDKTDTKYYRSENEKKNGVFASFRSKILSEHKVAVPVIDGKWLLDDVTLLVSNACARPWISFLNDLVEVRLTYLDDDIAEEANAKGCSWLKEKLEPGSRNTYNYLEYREKYIAEGIGQLATIMVTEVPVTFDGKETKALVSSYLNGTLDREVVTVWVVSGNTLAAVGGFPEDVWDVISRMSIGYVDMWDNGWN